MDETGKLLNDEVNELRNMLTKMKNKIIARNALSGNPEDIERALEEFMNYIHSISLTEDGEDLYLP